MRPQRAYDATPVPTGSTHLCGQHEISCSVSFEGGWHYCATCQRWSDIPCHKCTQCRACAEKWADHDRSFVGYYENHLAELAALDEPGEPTALEVLDAARARISAAEHAATPEGEAPGVALGPATPAPPPAPPEGERSPEARRGGGRRRKAPPTDNPLLPRRSKPGQLALFGRQPPLFSAATVKTECCAHCHRRAMHNGLCSQHVTGRLPSEVRRWAQSRSGGASNTPPQYATKPSKGRGTP